MHLHYHTSPTVFNILSNDVYIFVFTSFKNHNLWFALLLIDLAAKLWNSLPDLHIEQVLAYTTLNEELDNMN